MRQANAVEILAGLRAALDTATDDAERDHIRDMIETIRPLAALALRRVLTVEEQARVEDISHKLLAEAQQASSREGLEEMQHQAARAAEMEAVGASAAEKGAAENVAQTAQAHVSRLEEDIRRAGLDTEQAVRQKAADLDQEEKELEAAAAEERGLIAVQNKQLYREFNQIQQALRKEAERSEILRMSVGGARHTLKVQEDEAKAAAVRVAQLRAEARSAAGEPFVGEHLQKAAEREANELEANARRAVEEAKSSLTRARKAETANQREIRRAEKHLRKMEARGRAAEAEDANIQGNLDTALHFNQQARDDLARDAAEYAELLEAAKLTAAESAERAAAVPVIEAKLPVNAPKTRRRQRAAAAREAEEERAVDIIRRGLRAAGPAALAPPQEAEEERKDAPEPSRELDLTRVNKTELSALLEHLGVRGFTSVTKTRGAEGAKIGLEKLKDAETRGGVPPGTYRQVVGNIAKGLGPSSGISV